MEKYWYLAGLIDSEGSVMWISSGGKRKRFTIQIGLTEHHVIKWLRDEFGGNLTEHQPPNGHKMIWKWVLRGRPALELYEIVQTMLMIKNKNWRTNAPSKHTP